MVPERVPITEVPSAIPPASSSSSSTLEVPMTTLAGSENMPGRSALTVVPEDLPAIKYRHTMILVSRGLYSRRIAEMVCTSHEAMAVSHSRESEDDDDSPKNEHSAATEESSNNSSVAATDGGNVADSSTPTTETCACRRRKSRRDNKKCYCALSQSATAYPLQQQTSSVVPSTGPWAHNASISSSGIASPSVAGLARSGTSESAISLQPRGTASLDLRRGFSGSMAVISRIAFESVSHKYSATIPRLTSFSAAINTCLIFVLAADLPPSGPGPWAPDSPRSEGQAQSSTPSSAGVSSDVSGVDLGVCRVSAVEGVECGCFGFGFGHGRRHDGGNTEAMHGRSSSNEVEVRDDERIEDDLRMLELRLRQWQRQRQHLNEDSKPLSVLLVISDFDRKMQLDKEQHIFTKHERQTLKNKHTLMLSSVDSLWDKWGSRGERVLDDKIFTSWDGDRLHSVVTDLSCRLAHAYISSNPSNAA